MEFNTEQDKDIIMRSLRNLKGKANYSGISITDDYTVAQREIIKYYRTEVKVLNARHESEEYFFCVRGTPTDGLHIKKMKKPVAVDE